MNVTELPSVRSSSLDADPLAIASSVPDLAYLQTEFIRARDATGLTARLWRAQDRRFTRWPGQTEDGMKHQEEMPEGEDALPWDKSSDCRVPLCDDVINSLVDLACASFWSARIRTEPVAATRLTAAEASEVKTLLTWLSQGLLRDRLLDEVELSAQIAGEIGHALIYVGWRQETALQVRRLRLSALAEQAAAADPASPLSGLPATIADEEQEEFAAELLAPAMPSLTPTQRRRAVRELRNEGETEFAVPQIVQHGPELIALRPGQEVFTPPETTDLDNARAIFRVIRLSLAQMEAMSREHGWSQQWLAAVKAKLGQNSGQTDRGFDLTSAWNTERMGEIVYAYARQVDEKGVPGIWCTVFSPHITDSYADHWLVDYAHGQYPFIAMRLEVPSRRLTDARGVPETWLGTGQGEMKNQRDSLFNFAQLSIIPPLLEIGAYSKTEPVFAPAARIQASTPNHWLWFPPPPGKPEIAFELMAAIKRDVDEYFGRPNPAIPPSRSLARQQRIANRILGAWSAAMKQALLLCYQFLDPIEMESILGHPPFLDTERVLRSNVLMAFDVRSMDPEWTAKLIANVSQFLLPADLGGVIDRAKWLQLVMYALDPAMAQEIMTDQAGASQAVFEKVRSDLAQMALGNEALYAENDPAAGMKLQFLRQVIGANPRYVAQLESDPRFAEHLRKYQANLTQTILQDQNKQIGRLGVRPDISMRPGMEASQ